MPISSEADVQRAYQGTTVAAQYIQNRFTSELNRLLHERQVAAVQRCIDQLCPAATLEIAPGPGRLTRDLRPTGALTCLEFNEGMIRQGQAACAPTVNWVCGNAFDLPFAAASFDLVYTFRFIRHFKSADRERLYAQIRRVLKPGGCFVLDAVNEHVSRPLRDAAPQDYPVYDELYRADELCRELTAAGFTTPTLQPVQKRIRWQYRSQTFLGPRWNALNRLFIRTLERLPGGEGLEWIVTCPPG